MDARPQRPGRTLRFHDENDISHNGQAKIIHQRNKSTPALSTLAQGGIRAAVKRTVFADLSSNLKVHQPTKDDSALPDKLNVELQRESSKNPVSEKEKPSALLRPAQRPLQVSNNKVGQAAPLQAIGALSREKPEQGQNLLDNIATNRKAVTKKPTTIFKESSLPTVEEKVPAVPQVPLPTSAAPVHQPLPARKSEAASSAASSAASTHPLRETVAPVATTKPALARGVSMPGLRAQSTAAPIPQPTVKESKEPLSHVAVAPSTHLIPVDESRAVEEQGRLTYVDALELQAIAIEQESQHKPTRKSHNSYSEPEEYWEEEDEEEYFDAEGYTTARSLRSRGDNTTGCLTMVTVPKVTAKVEKELAAARLYVEATRTIEDIEDESWDTSMVAEYGEEIFEYMRTLEERMRPNPHYMDNQPEIQWSMRSVLMDWLVQVHHRFTLLPETLFLAINYVDRFLSSKIVSLGKLQLAGATAMFIAAKYEEINCPSVQEIVYMVDGGYTVEEILKAERFMLSMLQFELGWPGPMSFLRRISKADDYDLETRTLAKYFLEVTIMDERFVGCAPSFTAAGAHCLSRLMLKKGDWSPAHVHYSGYTFPQLRHLLCVLLECCEDPQKHHAAVYEKYADKRYKRASLYVENETRRGFRLPMTARESLRMSPPQLWQMG